MKIQMPFTIGSDPEVMIYNRSLGKIVSSLALLPDKKHPVDFTMEQAPLVVNEFLHWKMAEAIIYLVAWSIPAIILLCIARAFNQRSKSADVPKEARYKTDQNDYAILKWIFRAVALVSLTAVLTNYGMTITKIAVAPRVYLIEYVVSTVHNGVPPSQ